MSSTASRISQPSPRRDWDKTEVRSSNHAYLDETIEDVEVVPVPGEQNDPVRVGGGRDEDVHYPGSGLPSGGENRMRESAIRAGHGRIHRKGLESRLDFRQAPDSVTSSLVRVRQVDAEMQLGQGRRRDGALVGEGDGLGSDDHRGVEDSPHAGSQGSSKCWSSWVAISASSP